MFISMICFACSEVFLELQIANLRRSVVSWGVSRNAFLVLVFEALGSVC